MNRKCCVCKSSRQDAILHRFPCSELRLQKWLKCVNREDLNNLPPKKLSNLFVCQLHFEKRFLSSSESRLLSKAHPSLFTEGEISSGIPSQQNTENVDPVFEHNYARNAHFDHTYHKREPLKELSTSGTSVLMNTPGTSQSSPTSSPYCTAVNAVEMAKHIVIAPKASRKRLLHEVKDLTPTDVNVVEMSKAKHVIVPKASRKRLFHKIEDLTPTAKLIYQEYQRAKRQKDFYKRAKRALAFTKEQLFERLTKNMNPYAKKIMNMQIKLCNKNKKGRRFTDEEKLLALSIMKQSPKGYKFLHNIFILPSRSTLNNMVSKFNIETGICPQLFKLMKEKVASWNDKKKLCSVIFDEMSLETALNYNKNKDKITGFVELNKKTNDFADHALVFMLRGALYKWQQPLAFYYCQGATSGIELKNILKDVVCAVVGCGLKPIALICDQGAAFQSALKSLKQDTRHNQIISNQEPDGTVQLSGVTLSVIYDPSHLIKGIRNNFLNKDIIFDGKLAKWNDIVDVYKTDCNHTEARLLHKLTDEHVVPEKIKKMKVKNCVKVLSSTVSAALSYTAQFSHYADGRPVSNTLKNTAETVLFFDQLFDSINGASIFSKKNKGKILRTAVTAKSPHVQFWKEAILKLEKLKYVDSSGKVKSVPSITNFITTLKSDIRLWQIFTDQKIKIMRPRYFNSDPIENFFGQVRAYNYRNNNPNCHSFNCTFKSLLITRIIKFHHESFNCEDDPADQVLNLQSLFNEEIKESVGPDLLRSAENSIEKIVEQARRERINVHSRAYTAGWVVQKIFEKSKINCVNCKNSLTSQKSTTVHNWISHREFTKAKQRLNYPSEGAVRCFGTVVTETNEYLENSPEKINISRNIKEKIKSKYSFDFITCTEHKEILLDLFIVLTIRFAIINWCSVVNKILKGTDTIRLKNRILPAMQNKAYKKYVKKLKNKSFNK